MNRISAHMKEASQSPLSSSTEPWGNGLKCCAHENNLWGPFLDVRWIKYYLFNNQGLASSCLSKIGDNSVLF